MKSSIIAAIGLVFITTPAVAMEGKFKVIDGKTNSGDTLMLETTSISICIKNTCHGDSDVPDYSRHFNYVLIRKNGERKFNLDAYTPWCRYGKVQYDKRFYRPWNDPTVFTNPGWYIDNKYVIANSKASMNMLKEICSR